MKVRNKLIASLNAILVKYPKETTLSLDDNYRPEIRSAIFENSAV